MTEKRICLNRSVLDFMESVLTPKSTVIEFGSGWSTRWFAERCGKLLSIETSLDWYKRVKDDIAGFPGAEVRLVNTPHERLIDTGADLVLVDCEERLRLAATYAGWNLVNPGGWLVFDDAQRPKHRTAVNYMNEFSEPRRLEWNENHDLESARERLALAWQRPTA